MILVAIEVGLLLVGFSAATITHQTIAEITASRRNA